MMNAVADVGVIVLTPPYRNVFAVVYHDFPYQLEGLMVFWICLSHLKLVDNGPSRSNLLSITSHHPYNQNIM